MGNIKEEKAREIIDKYIKSLNSLEMSSVKYFMETGHLSGSFYSAIKDVIKAGFDAGKQERDRETLKWLKEVHKDYEHFGHEQHAAAIEYVIRKLEIENLSK